MSRPALRSTIPGGLVVTMAAALVMAAVPIAGQVTPFAFGFFLIAVALRLVVQRWGWRTPSLPLKLALVAVGIGGGVISTGTFLGIEAALSSVLILTGLKFNETNSARDLQTLALVGWFLGLCGLFFAQDLLRWLYVGVVCVLIGSSLVQFHRGAGAGRVWRSARLAGSMGLQALPVVAVFFMLFPRTYGGFRFTFGRPLHDVSGMSDRLDPGSLASLAMDQSIAFRVDFPEGAVPEQSQMYWRGGVLWRGDGFRWGRVADLDSMATRGTPEGPAIRQRFILEPHGRYWLFALDRPDKAPPRANWEAGAALRSSRPVHATYRYEVTSHPRVRESALPADHRWVALRPPSHVSPQLAALVDSWRAAAPDDRRLVETALAWFRREKFTYTLSPGAYEGEDALDDFLFHRRAGFCEHYAGAFASLMRVAGIPSRVVIGYHGGEFNRLGHYVIVRQSEAHAWTEVWLGDGWARIDPTEVIAPDRLTLGLDSLLHNAGDGAGGGGALSAGALGLRSLMRDLRFAWDNLNYQWDLRILGFDEENQRGLFTYLGLPYGRWILVAAWGLIILAPLVGALALWQRRSGRARRDPVVAAWAGFCRRLAEAGVARAPSEGPRAFTERAAAALPGRAAEIRRLGVLYISARYAREAAPPDDFIRFARVFAP